MLGKSEHYDYLFHFNPYTNRWNAFPRERMKDYFNGTYKVEDGLLTSILPLSLIQKISVKERMGKRLLSHDG